MPLLIVARHNENVDWTSQLDPRWTVRVVQKGQDLPNTGREGSSFAWAMHRYYDKTTDGSILAFVQGNPHPHCPEYGDELRRIADGQLDGFKWIGDTGYSSDAEGRPHHYGLQVGSTYERWLGKPFPGQVTFAAGGQFAITGRTLRQRPAEWYGWLMEQINDGDGPWIAERLWEHIFTSTTERN